MGLTLNTSDGQITLSSSTAGNYEITRTVTNSNGSLSSTATDIVVINPADNAAFSYSGSPYDIADASNPTPTVTGLSGGTFISNRNGFTFDGSDYIDTGVTPNTLVGSSNAYTVSAWVYPQSNGIWNQFEQEIIGAANYWSTAQRFSFFLKSTSGAASLSPGYRYGSSANGNAYTTTSNPTVPKNQWSHVAFTFDGNTTHKIHVNGNVVVTQTNGSAQTVSSTMDLAVGARNDNNSINSHFGGGGSGQLSNIAVWNSDQSTNMPNIYNNGSPQTSYTSSPVLWYKTDNSATYASNTWTIPNAANPGTYNGTSTTLPLSALSTIDVNSTTGLISLSTSTVGTYPIVYDTTGATGSICPATSTQSVQLVNTNFDYPSVVCNAAGSPNITPTNFIQQTGGQFTISPTSGLTINATSGVIYPASSTAGTYAITYTIGSNSTTKNVTSGAVLAPSTTTNTSTLSFNGTSSYINTNFNPSNSFVNGDSITISMWVKSNKGSFPTGLTLGGYDGSDRIYFQPYGNNGSLYFSLPDYNALTGWGSLSWNTWHHVVIVYDHNSASLKAYKNGVESTSAWSKYSGSGSLGSIDLSSINTNLYIGSDSNNGTANTFFQGEIDEVAIWNTVLTSCDVAGIYQASSNGITADLSNVYPSNLKYYNRMGE